MHMLGSLDERLQLFQSCCMIQQRCQPHARRSQLTVLGHHHHHQQLLLLLLLLASPSSACIFSRSRPICLYMCWSVFTVPPHVLFFSFFGEPALLAALSQSRATSAWHSVNWCHSSCSAMPHCRVSVLLKTLCPAYVAACPSAWKASIALTFFHCGLWGMMQGARN